MAAGLRKAESRHLRSSADADKSRASALAWIETPPIAGAVERVCSERAIAISGGRLTSGQVLALHKQLAADRLAFANTWAAWAHVFPSLVLVRLAIDAVEAAARDEARLKDLDREDRLAYARISRALQRHPRCSGDRSREPVPVARRRGRRNETDLRDFVIYLARSEYPRQGRAGAAWLAGVALAHLVWPRAGLTSEAKLEHIKRDGRRRMRSFVQPKSRACIYFFKTLAEGGFARILREVAESPSLSDGRA